MRNGVSGYTHRLPFAELAHLTSRLLSQYVRRHFSLRRRGQDDLRFAANQGGDQDIQVRSLRPACIHLFAHDYDNGLSDGLGSLSSAPYFPLPNWEKLDWGLSQINLDNSFTGSVIYDLPFGKGKMFGGSWNPVTNTLLGNWQLTLIERVSSGFPVPLIDSNNQSGSYFQNGGNGNNWNRPNRISGCDPYNANHSQNQWMNTACFAAPPVGELGNASRVPS